MASTEIPNRSLFKPAEVCDITQIQAYVLRSWETEFPELGVRRGGLRVYRRQDVERVLRIKHLLFVDGLTLAGARRRLEEDAVPEPTAEELSAAKIEERVRRQIADVREGLQSILRLLGTEGPHESEASVFDLLAQPSAPVASRRPSRSAKPKAAKERARARASR
jgi:DNA-binding transcriptional MerR regulator